MTPAPARAHHYVPEFYLAGFTVSGSRDDQLWVFDRKQNKSWPTKPANIGHERDFYRVDIDGVELDAVEKELSQLEAQSAEALRRISVTRKMAEGEDLTRLLVFVALQITRVPQFRRMYESSMAQSTKWQGKMALSHPRFFGQFVEEMQKQGKEVPDEITRESLLEFLKDESRYTIEIPREASIQNMAEMADFLVPVLAKRSWSLLVAKDGKDDFVCSDRPVILVPTRPHLPPFIGFGVPDTEVIMPLNRQMALVGHWDREGQVCEADRMIVGLINQRMLDFSERFIYSARDAFPVTVSRDDSTAAQA